MRFLRADRIVELKRCTSGVRIGVVTVVCRVSGQQYCLQAKDDVVCVNFQAANYKAFPNNCSAKSVKIMCSAQFAPRRTGKRGEVPLC